MSQELVDVPSSLSIIESAIRTLGRIRLINALVPGGDRTLRQSVPAVAGNDQLKELEQLYSWRGGTDTGAAARMGDIALFPGFYLLNPVDAARDYQSISSDPRWALSWWPVFANGGGDFYAIDFARSGAVRHFRIDEEDQPIEFGSINAMLATLASAYVEGAIYVNENGYLAFNDELFALIAARLNPDVPWWTDEL